MPKLYLMRHAESEANRKQILAAQLDYPLSEKGKRDAAEIAANFKQEHTLDRIIASPLTRAVQTATPFAELFHLQIETDVNLMEQNLGKFAGMHYEIASNDPAYENDKTKRWNWVPEGGGESYETVVGRIVRFFESMDHEINNCNILLVSHGVTMRLIRGVLENTIPRFPHHIADNGEIWMTQFVRLNHPHVIQSLIYN